MNPPRDDEYAGLDDLLGGDPDDARADDSRDATAPVADPDADPRADPGPVADPGVGSGSRNPVERGFWGGLPTDLQAEYAEAYRRGYERARREKDKAGSASAEKAPAEKAPAERDVEAGPREPEPLEPEPPAALDQDAEPTQALVLGTDAPGVGRPAGDAEPTRMIARTARTEPTPRTAPAEQTEPTQRIEPGTLAKLRESALAAPQAASSAIRDRTGREPHDRGSGGHEPRDRRLVAAWLGALALLVIAAAFGVGRLFADTTSSSHSAQVASGASGSGEPVYRGPLRKVAIADAMASCQANNSYDAAGNVVSYQPANAYDADLATAWRCDGSGRGQRFTVSLPEGTKVAQVGLVPGYAKTDPASGADRYTENNRITKVRWRFDDGTAFVQRMSGDPANRSMRTMRIPETATHRVVLEILASQPGTRNTVAISELRIASPRG